MTIQALVVDDNPMNLDVLQKALELEGVSPYLCHHPNDIAPALDEAGNVQLVFLDLEFPNYDGLKLIHSMKQDPRLANVPFVAYTVHISQQNEAAEAGFHSFLGKPLNVDMFHDYLQRILAGEPVWELGQ
jgi:CheY-like chemotaxis protein